MSFDLDASEFLDLNSLFGFVQVYIISFLNVFSSFLQQQESESAPLRLKRKVDSSESTKVRACFKHDETGILK